MGVILDELQKYGIDNDMRTLSNLVKYLLERYEALYNQVILDVIIPMIYPQFLMR